MVLALKMEIWRGDDGVRATLPMLGCSSWDCDNLADALDSLAADLRGQHEKLRAIPRQKMPEELRGVDRVMRVIW